MSRSTWLKRALRRAPNLAAAEHGAGPVLGARLRMLLPVVLVAAFFAVIAAIGVAHVTLRLEELATGRALSETHETRLTLEKQRQELSVEIGALKSPDRVLPAARERLLLLPPKPSQTGSVPR